MNYKALARKHGGSLAVQELARKHGGEVIEVQEKTYKPRSWIGAKLSTAKLNANAANIQAASGVHAALYEAYKRPTTWRREEQESYISHEQRMLEADYKLSVTPGLLQARTELEHETIAVSRAKNEVEKTLAVNAGRQGMTVTDSSMIVAERQRSAIKVQETTELERIRLQGYSQEIDIDLNAALDKRLIAQKVARSLLADIHNLLRERTELLEDDRMDEYSKKIAVEETDNLIQGYRKDLNEQMARHFLSGRDLEDVQGVHPKENGAAHNQ